MKNGKKTTIRDVAKVAGISPATVSLITQGKGSFSDETRRSVLDAVERTGYEIPKRRKLQPVGRQFIIVVDDLNNPNFSALFEGVNRILVPAGHFATLTTSNDSVDVQAVLLERIWKSDVDGVILVPATGTRPENLRHFEEGDKPLIMAVRRIGQTSFNYVGANPMVGMQIAVEHLVELGHRHIGFVGGIPDNYAYGERHAGIASSLMSKGIKFESNLVISGASTRDFGRKATETLLAAKERPTAIIAYNDNVAFGVLDALSSAKLVPGRDIAVMGHDDNPEAARQPVPLSTISTPADELGEIIGKALQDAEHDGTLAKPIDITLPPKLVIRDSCGAKLVSSSSLGGRNRAGI